ncbi:MAG: methyltransferase domain-containing protein [Halobacteriovoraceae bacterium]|mgnify:CR=1 FL=1|jgi:glyoxylase I family protein|nr:methyltransferase domain-containing protein [Halobacteriovoraceae bacterium]MBT5094254.1 methyltransferase domain-containing protein [Halobacteriovoraceae bacterium]
MDFKTLNRYQESANTFIDRYYNAKPGRLYELMATFFKMGGTTLDIGCASGRDLAYLKGAGYQVEGLDAVAAFVEHCQETLKDVPVFYDSLPHLEKLDSNHYDNILLSAVLMHVTQDEIPIAAKNIMRVLSDKGRVLLTFRNQRQTLANDVERENDGRLYSEIELEQLISLFKECGGKLLFAEKQSDEEREDVTWHNLVFEKSDQKVIKKEATVIGLDHIYFSVRDLKCSEEFYDRIMPVLGFKKSSKPIDGDEHIHYFCRHYGISLRSANNGTPDFDAYAPGLHHFCFRVDSKEDLQEIYLKLKENKIELAGPKLFKEYAEDYHAIFFNDPNGIRLEVTNYREQRRRHRKNFDDIE